MSLEERSRERRRRMVGNRATSFAEAERWDLEFWQSVPPEERLSALVGSGDDAAGEVAADRIGPVPEPEPIVTVRTPIDPRELQRLVALFFEDMVKLVVDLDRRVVAVGGELHADAEALLLASGSRQADLWGANYYPGRGEQGCIEYTAPINIRPAQGNHGMELDDPELRLRVRELTFELIGCGEALS